MERAKTPQSPAVITTLPATQLTNCKHNFHSHMQSRVKGALLRKEESLSALQQQVTALTSQLHAAEAALAQHQAEMQLLA
jgi:multidrug resistance efflux pump